MKKMMIITGLMLMMGMSLALNERKKMESASSTPVLNEINMNYLKPIIPLEATFEEIIDTKINIDSLIPKTPKEADFEK